MRLGHALSTLLGTCSEFQFKQAERYLLGWDMPSSHQALQLKSPGSSPATAPANSQSLDVFISYAREDQDAVHVVAARLEARGLVVWWDHEINTGARWETEILSKLRAAKVVLVMWSPFSVTSEWVRREAEIARENVKLVPAFLRRCRLPTNFNDLQTSDLTRWDGDPSDLEWQKVTTSIEALV
jgi:hypothetical protein